MQQLHYEIVIDASPQKVWATMLEKPTYRQWTGVAWPGSSYHGEWTQGAQIRFTGEDGKGGGTVGEITELDPYARVAIEHVAVLLDDGSEDRESDLAKGWIGSTEAYTLTGQNGATKLEIDIATAPDWVSMFDEGWPPALAELKTLAER